MEKLEDISKIIGIIVGFITVGKMLLQIVEKIMVSHQKLIVPIKKDLQLNPNYYLCMGLKRLLGIGSVIFQLGVLKIQIVFFMNGWNRTEYNLCLLLSAVLIGISIVLIAKQMLLSVIWGMIWLFTVIWANIVVIQVELANEKNNVVWIVCLAVPLLIFEIESIYENYIIIKKREKNIKKIWGIINAGLMFCDFAILYLTIRGYTVEEGNVISILFGVLWMCNWILLEYWEPELIPVIINTVSGKYTAISPISLSKNIVYFRTENAHIQIQRDMILSFEYDVRKRKIKEGTKQNWCIVDGKRYMCDKIKMTNNMVKVIEMRNQSQHVTCFDINKMERSYEEK